MHPNISDAEDIQPRGVLVVLEGLRSSSGPVSVWVEPMDPLDSARLFNTWGGGHPQVGIREEVQVSPDEVGGKVETISRPLIEKCVKVKKAGVLVQAFSWSGESVLPTSNLTAGDIANLTQAVTGLMSVVEGEQGAGFPVGDGDGLGAGVGAVEGERQGGAESIAGA